MGGFKGEWMARLVSGEVDSWRHIPSQCIHEAGSVPRDAGDPPLFLAPPSKPG